MDAANRQVERTTLRRQAAQRGEQNLREIFSTKLQQEETESELLDVLNVIGKFEKIKFKSPLGDIDETLENYTKLVQDVSVHSRVRARIVNLHSQKKWWFGDNGALLGFLRRDSTPVALIPRCSR